MTQAKQLPDGRWIAAASPFFVCVGESKEAVIQGVKDDVAAYEKQVMRDSDAINYVMRGFQQFVRQ